ncbi:MAG: hypothetical protein V1797_08240 [Pseudomonadota bacterium]
MPQFFRRLGLALLLMALAVPVWAIEMSADVVRSAPGRTEKSKVFIKTIKSAWKASAAPWAAATTCCARTRS